MIPNPNPTLTICKVWDDDYPWDVRVEKIAGALTTEGHQVHLAARNRLRIAATESFPEATVHRLRPWRWLPASLDRAAMFPAFVNPRWYRHIVRVARQAKADVVLCRDLPLAPTSIVAARALGIPVLLDMAENYPAMLQSRISTGRRGPLDAMVRNPALARAVERWTLRHIDGVLVVVDESAERIIAAGVPRSRTAVVSNTPPLSRLSGPVAQQARVAQTTVVYLGIIEAQRGIATLLDAMEILRRERQPMRLVLYGDGVDGALFRRSAEAQGLTPHYVEFRGRLPNPVALKELATAQIGVVPHWKDESWDTTVPNKLFDYMAAGLAVVTSDVTPCARIVRETGAGLVYRDRDAVGLATSLRKLQDPDIRSAAAARGRAAIAETYHWERDVERMLRLLQSVVGT